MLSSNQQMPRVLIIKFAISLVAVLIFGQLQCVGACVSFASPQAADQKLPPCHRQHNSKHSRGSASDACSHEISAAGLSAQTVASTVPPLAAIPVMIHLPLG